MKKKDKKERKQKKKTKAFKNVQQNIAVSSSTPYFATHYIPPTIRSRDYSEARIIPAFNPFDSFGLESQYPKIASDSFIVQIPKPHLEINSIRHNERMAYNQLRDVVGQPPPAQPPAQAELPFVEPVTEVPKPKRVYKKKVKIVAEE